MFESLLMLGNNIKRNWNFFFKCCSFLGIYQFDSNFLPKTNQIRNILLYTNLLDTQINDTFTIYKLITYISSKISTLTKTYSVRVHQIIIINCCAIECTLALSNGTSSREAKYKRLLHDDSKFQSHIQVDSGFCSVWTIAIRTSVEASLTVRTSKSLHIINTRCAKVCMTTRKQCNPISNW